MRLILGILLSTTMALAGEVTLRWDYTNPTGQGVTAYRVKWGPTPGGPYTQVREFAATGQEAAIEQTIQSLLAGNYSFIVTAFCAACNSGAGKESDPSNEVSTVIALPPPTGLQITNVTASAWPTRALIAWDTDKAATSTVAWGPAPDRLTSSYTDGALDTRHVLDLRWLNRRTTYYYRVRSEAGGLAGQSDILTFTTR